MSDKTLQKGKVFFPNLDGLRFICFLLVFLFHWNLTCAIKIENVNIKNSFDFLFRNGNIGVNIFFVLSGFLITYLLIIEKKLVNDISLTNFYIRRILRIWPLYYLIIILGFVVFSYFKFGTIISSEEPSNFYYYLGFFANFDLIRIWPTVPDALPLIVLWSVAVEEQFYLTWPIFLKYIGIKNLPYLFVTIVLFTLIFRSFYTGHNDHEYAIRYFHTFSVIGDMALGGLLAYYCSYKNKFLDFIIEMPKKTIVFIYIITTILVLFKQEIFYYPLLLTVERVILSTLFALIIAEQNFSKNSFFKFSRFKILTKMGIYTYGLYCMQFIGILLVQKGFDKFGFNLGIWGINLFGSVVALLIVIVISMASYHFFEKYFLKKKDKFSVILKK